MRPQPPSLKTPPRGNSTEGWNLGREAAEPEVQPRKVEDTAISTHQEPNWQQRAKDAYRFSTTYLDSNMRRLWDDSLRAFNNEHPGDSKYNSETFKKRSHLFVPVTRTIIRKNEAAACQAFFSNQDLISIEPMNQAEKPQKISAAIMKELIQHRLTKTIPWFMVIIGGIQDAQAQGACIAEIKWNYETKEDLHGEEVACKDEPEVDVFALENLRLDPSSHWMDPINSSPYLIREVPMYVGDIKDRMETTNPKNSQWKRYGDDEIMMSEDRDDSTRMARLGHAQDPSKEKRDISDYDVAWVQLHIHRWRNADYFFYTLSNGNLLTDPAPLEKYVFHGRRPFVLGRAHIETHKPLPTPIPALVKPLQDGINLIENQTNDNVLFVLNKRYKVKRGANVDTASLVRNVPGGVTMVDNMEDLEEINWPDVSASSYQQLDRKRMAFDDLVGNFNPSTLHQTAGKDLAQGSIRMLQGSSAVMTEYMLQTFAITFAIPVIRQIVLLEQHYETDQTILAIAGQKAQVFQRFGVDQVTDEMLDHELTTNVNVGMGATDPIAKLQRFLNGCQAFANICAKPPPGVNLGEVWKEIMALCGYQDGDRFSTEQTPEVAKLEQVIQQLTQQVQDLERTKNEKTQGNILKFQANRENNATKMEIEDKKQGHDRVQTYAQHILDQGTMMLEAALQPPPMVAGAGGGGMPSQGAGVPATA